MPGSLWKFPSPRARLGALAAIAALLLPAGVSRSAAQNAPPHPIVPGFERFFTAPGADAAKGGQLLLGELNCVSCHKADAVSSGLVLQRQAPILDGVASRVQRGFLRKFLGDPHAVKPGTVMPDVFAGLPHEEKLLQVEALVHFLASTGALAQERPEPKTIAAGRDLYQKVGCVACHGTRDADGKPGKLFPTSVALPDLKAKYSLHSLIAFLENPQHTRPSGRMPGLLTGKEARAVANYLLQGIPFKTAPPNVTYTYYEGDWDRLPDFAKLQPRATGKASGFDLTLARRPNNFAMKFEGYLRIDRDGDYRFHLTSDDGSKLFLDGKLAVANDGIHPPSTVGGSVKLTKGVHHFVAGVFNAGGGVELNVEVEGPGLGRQNVGRLLWLTAQGNPQEPAAIAKADEDDFPLEPALVVKGREVFASAGCASCHQLNVGGQRLQPRRVPQALAKLGPDAGCLAAAPGKGVPHYALTGVQRAALIAALRVKAGAPAPPAARAAIARTMTAFNCYACHQRDKVGGAEEALNPLFTTAEREMGDEGRLPPPLDGVGAKMNPAYLRKVLGGGSKDRPYMHTRMPAFGDQNVGHLAQAFEAVDTLAPVAKPVFTQTLPRVKAAGRHMVGNALGCIKCHTFAGHKAEGVQGIDMTLMTQRVRRDWFHRYLIDPQKFRPGTRMPTSWPGGVTFLKDVLDGDTLKQVEAVWLYLADGGRALLPPGMKKHSIALVPDKEAIIYRNFIEGAGTRAIAVGYPEKAHLAFDANEGRLAMVWQGAFMDAARHWMDRGAGFEQPLGDNIVHLPKGPAFAVLAKPDEKWPAKSAKEVGYKFGGYRLTPDERPTFLYTYHGVKVEDFPKAVAGKAAPSFQRTLTLTAERPVADLWFRAVVADRIEAVGNGWYRIDGEWRLRIESGAPPQVRLSNGKQELLVPVRFDGKRARIVQELVW